MASLIDLANPTRFMRLSQLLLPWMAGASALLFVVGFYLAWFVAPADYQQGETIRIMFVHVPAAWLALMLYTMMALSALGTLVWRHPLADVAQKAAARSGLFRADLSPHRRLLGQADVGHLLGLGCAPDLGSGAAADLSWHHRALAHAGRSRPAGRAVAILTLVGFVNVPIIKFSVDWWNTLHQPASVFRVGGPTIHPSMLWPLLILAVAFTLLALSLHLVAMRAEIMRRRVRTLTILEAERLDRLALAGAPA